MDHVVAHRAEQKAGKTAMAARTDDQQIGVLGGVEQHAGACGHPVRRRVAPNVVATTRRGQSRGGLRWRAAYTAASVRRAIPIFASTDVT